MDNLDTAVENRRLITCPHSHSARPVTAQKGLEQTCTHQREALIYSAVDFRQPSSGTQVLAMREHYPVLPHRSRSAQDGPVNHAAGLAGTSFPPDTVLEAVIPHADAPRPATHDPRRPAGRRAWRMT